MTSTSEFMDAFCDASTFEIIESNAIVALKDYLLPNDWRDPQVLIRRYSTLIKAAGHTKNSNAFQSLVKRLSDALASSENLSIAIASITPSSSRRGREDSADDANLSGLVRPFKVRFKRESNDHQELADYSNNVVLVEPFATLSAIEDFLYPRVHKSSGAPRRSARFSPPANMDEDMSEDDEDDEDEEPVLGDEGEGDGRDLDLTNEDIPQEDAAPEDDRPACANRSDSFAARAAAANATNKLVFSVNGEVLHPSTTILQAVGIIALSENTQMTEKSWEKTNNIMYRSMKPSDVLPTPLQLGGVKDAPKDDLAKINELIADLGNRNIRATLGAFVPALCGKVKSAVASEETSQQMNDLLDVLTVLHEIGVSASRILLLDGCKEAAA
ncbi:MAG: hypothetical protein ACO4AM_07710, partial [Candidatus Nanopelagicaceae bacterium]